MKQRNTFLSPQRKSLVLGLTACVLVLIVAVEGRQMWTVFSGALTLLNCLHHIATDNSQDRTCSDQSVAAASQQSTLSFAQILQHWNDRDYAALTLAAECLDSGCVCGETSVADSKAGLHQNLKGFYVTLAYQALNGQFPDVDTCQDSFVSSTFVRNQSRSTSDPEQVVALSQLAYLIDQDWEDAWQRGQTAFQQAARYRNQDDLVAAEQAYEVAVEAFRQSKNPGSLERVSMSLAFLGEIALEQGNHDRAESRFRSSIASSPQSAARSFRGLVRVWSDNGLSGQEMVSEFEEIRRSLGPDDFYLTSGAASALQNVGDLEAALGVVRSAPMEVQEKLPALTLELIGQIHETNRDLAGAEQAFKAGMTLVSPDDGSALARFADHLARIYRAQGRLAEAIANWERATEINPQVARYWNSLGLAYEENGDLTQARGALERALALAPNNAAYRRSLIRLQP